eukprot:COSAG02_NODE_22922_length_735_cov_3.515723_1_plen_72_part_00
MADGVGTGMRSARKAALPADEKAAIRCACVQLLLRQICCCVPFAESGFLTRWIASLTMQETQQQTLGATVV